MIFTPIRLEDAHVIDVERRTDERGFLARTFCEREFAENGLPMRIVQSSTIRTTQRGTLRGLLDLPGDGRPAARVDYQK